MIISLTATERNKFASWLEQTAGSNESISEQMKKLPHAEVLIRKFATETEACRIIAKMLRSIEDVTIGGDYES